MLWICIVGIIVDRPGGERGEGRGGERDEMGEFGGFEKGFGRYLMGLD